MNRLLLLASALSLLLCLAFGSLWVRSRKLVGPGDQVIFAATNSRVWEVSTLQGAVYILTVPGFSHPRIASVAVLPRRAASRGFPPTYIVLNVDKRSHPSAYGTFLGVFYRSDLARPGVWDHDNTNIKTYEALEAMPFHEIFIPSWLPTLITGAGGLYLLVPLLRWLRRRKRLRSGRCVQCGYDLRAASRNALSVARGFH